MEPYHFRYGNVNRYPPPTANDAASMEPYHFRYGNQPKYERLMRGYICFNGAIPFQVWKRYYDIYTLCNQSTLQWSHTISGMETLPKEIDFPQLNMASMEPYHFRYGNFAEYIFPSQSYIASMEPYHFRYGNPNAPDNLRVDCSDASMEPYHFRYGNPILQAPNKLHPLRFNGAIPFQVWKL